MQPEVETEARVVVCDDDEITRQLICENLEADRYEPLPAPTATDALRRSRYESPDILVLDLGLPDASGLDVLREIRGRSASVGCDPELPILILSGRGATQDRVRGLGAGADDYLVKPFSYPELLERIRAVLRRRGEHRAGPVRLGDLSFDAAARRVAVAGREVELANKEFELLKALIAEPTRVFTKRELLESVWDFRAPGRTRTLDSHASRLRRKLDPERGRYVINCWGVGYRLLEP